MLFRSVMEAVGSEKCATVPSLDWLWAVLMKLQRRRRFVTAPPFFHPRAWQCCVTHHVKITRAAAKSHLCRAVMRVLHLRTAAITACAIMRAHPKGSSSGVLQPQARSSRRGKKAPPVVSASAGSKPVCVEQDLCNRISWSAKRLAPAFHVVRSTGFYCCLTWSHHGMVV